MHFKSPLQVRLVASHCFASAAVCVQQLPRKETWSIAGQVREFLIRHDYQTGPHWVKQTAKTRCLLPLLENLSIKLGALFWKSQVLPQLRVTPRAQTFHWIPHPCACTSTHACQRLVFMERGESQRPPVVSLHSAKKKFQFLSSFTTRTAARLYGAATKARRMSENENQ